MSLPYTSDTDPLLQEEGRTSQAVEMQDRLGFLYRELVARERRLDSENSRIIQLLTELNTLAESLILLRKELVIERYRKAGPA